MGPTHCLFDQLAHPLPQSLNKNKKLTSKTLESNPTPTVHIVARRRPVLADLAGHLALQVRIEDTLGFQVVAVERGGRDGRAVAGAIIGDELLEEREVSKEWAEVRRLDGRLDWGREGRGRDGTFVAPPPQLVSG